MTERCGQQHVISGFMDSWKTLHGKLSVLTVYLHNSSAVVQAHTYLGTYRIWKALVLLPSFLPSFLFCHRFGLMPPPPTPVPHPGWCVDRGDTRSSTSRPFRVPRNQASSKSDQPADPLPQLSPYTAPPATVDCRCRATVNVYPSTSNSPRSPSNPQP